MKESLFIPGYLNDMILRGERPKYGYPKTTLPKVPEGYTMKVVSSYSPKEKSAKTDPFPG